MVSTILLLIILVDCIEAVITNAAGLARLHWVDSLFQRAALTVLRVVAASIATNHTTGDDVRKALNIAFDVIGEILDIFTEIILDVF